MNFLYALEKNPRLAGELKLAFVVAKNSAPHDFLRRTRLYRYYVFSANPVVRILQEVGFGAFIVLFGRYSAIYSYFGFAFYVTARPQVCGSADSNLFFPEVDFWHHYKGLARLRRRLVDAYRLWGLRQAAAVVFENTALEARAARLYKLKRTKVILPSIEFPSCVQRHHFQGLRPLVPKGLFLCGWQLNKNVMLIPAIAAAVRAKGHDIQFLLTAPPDDSQAHREFVKLVADFGVAEMVNVVGPVSKEQLDSVYQTVDMVFLLSKLESFSNNIIEAWHYAKPLVVSDEEWARSICRDGAAYVDRDSPAQIAAQVKEMLSDPSSVERLVANGRERLKSYPSTAERVLQELEFVRDVSKAH